MFIVIPIIFPGYKPKIGVKLDQLRTDYIPNKQYQAAYKLDIDMS
jgi:hypothetical protein